MNFRALSVICLLLTCALQLCYAQVQLPVFKYAENIEVSHFPSHRLISIKNTYKNSKQRKHFALVSHSYTKPLPNFPKGTQVIRTPVKKVIALNTTFIGFIDAIDQQANIIAVSQPEFVQDPIIHQGIESGRIQTVHTGPRLDVERLLQLQPDLILSTTIGGGSFQSKLQRAGLPLALSADYMEASPLARAEWIKFVAAFFEADDAAAKLFDQVAASYQAMLEKTENIAQRPTVFTGAPYSGAWYIPGGRSYMAQYLKDAGADYIWKSDRSSGAIPLDFERVFIKAANADIWLDPSHYKKQKQLLNADPRFKKFKAFKQNQIYNNTRQMQPNGGNNIWEQGIVRPDQVLADLISIFHPDRLPNHQPVYYEAVR